MVRTIEIRNWQQKHPDGDYEASFIETEDLGDGTIVSVGPYADLVDMTDEEIERQLQEDF